MPHHLITLLAAIRRGIIRIFPLPISLPASLLTVLILLLLCTLIGCGAQRQTVSQTVRDVHTDTVYLTSLRYDSIHILRDRQTDLTRDTVYLRDISVEYRYRRLRDTIRIVERDSIPYEVTVTETREITRPLTWFDRICRVTFLIVLIAAIAWIWKRWRRR